MNEVSPVRRVTERGMFAKDGPTLFELIHQALSSTQRGYDLLAPKFDASPFRTPDDMLDFAVRSIGTADVALDVCCGTGAAMQFLRPVCRHRIVGLDFSPGMLLQAKQNLEQTAGTAKVEFVEADVMRMNFREEFDLATCFGGLGHIPPGEESAFLRLVHRALKSGGRYIFYSGYRPHLLSPRNILLRTFNVTMKVRNALLKPPFIMYYFNFLLPQTAEELKRLGFVVDIRPGPYGRHRLIVATKS